MAITQEFNLNMIPDSAPVVVHVNQYDEGEGRLVIHLLDGMVPYVPSAGAEAIIQGTKPDGKGFDYNATLSGSTVTANVTKQMTAVCGSARTQVVITEGDNITGTFVFDLVVQKSGLPAETDMSESDYQIVEQMIEAAEEAEAISTQSAEDSEAWATGKRSGQDVPTTDPTYHNNSKYWADKAHEELDNKADLVNGKVPASQLPSYVDDVIEGYYNPLDGKFYKESTYETEIEGERDKIYIDLATDKSYRWSGSVFSVTNDPDIAENTLNRITTSTATYPEFSAGETLKVIFGKIKKFLSDLHDKKADKVTSATSGNFAALDSNGNLTDSGKSKSATIPSGGTTGQVLKKTSNTDYEVEWSEAGHTILNDSGSAMNQRSKLQFDGLNVSDDSGNDKTVVAAPTPDYVDAQYNSTTTYSKGMTCIYGNKRYRSIYSGNNKGHTPPNATYWEEFSVSSQLGGRWDLIAQTSVTGTNTTSMEQNIAYPNINLSNYNYKELLLKVSYYKSSDGYSNQGSIIAPISELNVVGNSNANWLDSRSGNGRLRGEIIVRNNIITEIRAYLASAEYNHDGYTCHAKLFAR